MQNHSYDFYKIPWERKKRLEFDGSPDLDPDPGIFWKKFHHCGIGNGKSFSL